MSQYPTEDEGTNPMNILRFNNKYFKPFRMQSRAWLVNKGCACAAIRGSKIHILKIDESRK